MGYTSSDLADIQAAIIAFGNGRRVGSVQIGDKLIRYAETTLADLLAVKAEIQSDLGSWIPRTYARNGGRAS